MTLSRPQRLLWIASLWMFYSACLSATADSQTLMGVLLRPNGWSVDWSGPGGTGLSDVTFELRSDRIFAKISVIKPVDYATKCENPVTVGTNSVTFDGCYEPNVRLYFSPTDPEFALRGGTPSGV